MLDIKRIRKNPEELERAMKARRSKGADVSGLLELDRERRVILQESEALKAQRNEVSAKIPIMKRNGENTDELMASMKSVAARIKELDENTTKSVVHTPSSKHQESPQLICGRCKQKINKSSCQW